MAHPVATPRPGRQRAPGQRGDRRRPDRLRRDGDHAHARCSLRVAAAAQREHGAQRRVRGGPRHRAHPHRDLAGRSDGARAYERGRRARRGLGDPGARPRGADPPHRVLHPRHQRRRVLGAAGLGPGRSGEGSHGAGAVPRHAPPDGRHRERGHGPGRAGRRDDGEAHSRAGRRRRSGGRRRGAAVAARRAERGPKRGRRPRRLVRGGARAPVLRAELGHGSARRRRRGWGSHARRARIRAGRALSMGTSAAVRRGAGQRLRRRLHGQHRRRHAGPLHRRVRGERRDARSGRQRQLDLVP